MVVYTWGYLWWYSFQSAVDCCWRLIDLLVDVLSLLYYVHPRRANIAKNKSSGGKEKWFLLNGYSSAAAAANQRKNNRVDWKNWKTNLKKQFQKWKKKKLNFYYRSWWYAGYSPRTSQFAYLYIFSVGIVKQHNNSRIVSNIESEDFSFVALIMRNWSRTFTFEKLYSRTQILAI